MTSKKALLCIICAALGATLSSCKLEDDTVAFHFVNLQIVSAELPESFDLYDTYQVKVTYIRPNNCTFFEGFDISKAGATTRNVVAYGSELDHAECAEIAAEVEEYFLFTCNYNYTYTFRFWAGEDENGEAEFIEYEVPVNPE